MPFSLHTQVGERFGSRVITELLEERDSDGHRRVAWKCDCGNTGTGGLKGVRHTANCPKCRPDNLPHTPIHGHSSRGGKRTHLYDAWANMMQRVRGTGSPRNDKWYKGKGITVCPEWMEFEGFLDWAVNNGYQPGLSLDRISPAGNYEPGNCQWVTRNENSRRAWHHNYLSRASAAEICRLVHSRGGDALNCADWIETGYTPAEVAAALGDDLAAQ